MKISAKVNIDVAKILAKRGLGTSDKAEIFLANEVKRLCDPYVPMQQGTLKNTAQIINDSSGTYILYDQPYADYQYNGVSRSGKTLNYHDSPTRGKQWDKRMMADKGREVVKSFADYLGGKAK